MSASITTDQALQKLSETVSRFTGKDVVFDPDDPTRYLLQEGRVWAALNVSVSKKTDTEAYMYCTVQLCGNVAHTIDEARQLKGYMHRLFEIAEAIGTEMANYTIIREVYDVSGSH